MKTTIGEIIGLGKHPRMHITVVDGERETTSGERKGATQPQGRHLSALVGERITTIGERKGATQLHGKHLSALDGERTTTIGERKNSKTTIGAVKGDQWRREGHSSRIEMCSIENEVNRPITHETEI